jgi:hypothetical protein
MTARPSGRPNAWIATAFNVVSLFWIDRDSLGSIGTLPDAAVRLAKLRAMTDRLPHTLRSDARDNRELILDAARALFAAEGSPTPTRGTASAL